jgi:hypothetical protein
MKRLAVASGSAPAADDSRVKTATNQVESGAKKIPDGQIGDGVKRFFTRLFSK